MEPQLSTMSHHPCLLFSKGILPGALPRTRSASAFRSTLTASSTGDGKSGLLVKKARIFQGQPRSFSGLKRIVQFCIVVLATILCIASHPVNSGLDIQGSGSSHLGHPAFLPSAFFQQPSTPQSLAQPFAGPAVSPVKDRVNAFSLMTRASDRAVGTAFVLLAIAQWYQLLDLRRCALLFPFHFFW